MVYSAIKLFEVTLLVGVPDVVIVCVIEPDESSVTITTPLSIGEGSFASVTFQDSSAVPPCRTIQMSLAPGDVMDTADTDVM